MDELDCYDCGEQVLTPGELVHDGQIFVCECGTWWRVSDYGEDGIALVRVEDSSRTGCTRR
jgi:hypothetical protein